MKNRPPRPIRLKQAAGAPTSSRGLRLRHAPQGPAGWRRRRARPTAPTWASSPSGPPRTGSRPFDLTPRMLRRYAGVMSERGLSKSSVARKIASIRAFYRHLVQRGLLEANPADLVATPKKDQYLPRVLKPAEAAGVLDAIPAGGPLELRDRAMFEVAYGCGPARRGAREPRRDRPRPRRRGDARDRQGVEDAHRAGGRAGLAGDRALPRPRPPEARRRGRRRAPRGARAVPLEERPAAVDLGRSAPPEGLDAACGYRVRA